VALFGLMEYNGAERNGTKWNGVEGAEWNRNSIPLFGYLILWQNNIFISLFRSGQNRTNNELLIIFLPLF
jgi:hypothetical protein